MALVWDEIKGWHVVDDKPIELNQRSQYRLKIGDTVEYSGIYGEVVSIPGYGKVAVRWNSGYISMHNEAELTKVET
jgi:hypothetical protein